MYGDNVIEMLYGHVISGKELLEAAPVLMRNMLTQLEQDLAPLTSSWQGEARLEYQRIKTAWQQDCDRLQQIAHRFAPTLGEAHRQTSRTDFGLATDWSGV